MFQGMEYIYEVYKEKAFPKLLLLFHFAAFFKRQCKTWKTVLAILFLIEVSNLAVN